MNVQLLARHGLIIAVPKRAILVAQEWTDTHAAFSLLTAIFSRIPLAESCDSASGVAMVPAPPLIQIYNRRLQSLKWSGCK